MNFRTLTVGGVLGMALLPMLGLLLLTPSPALAQGPFATVTAWEVQEFLRFKTGEDEDSIVGRLANATLVGHGTDGLCTFAQNPCALDGRAQSSVNLSTGQGPISGAFDILVDMNPGSPLLMDLVHADKVEFKGTLNLGPALLFVTTGGGAGAPVAFASGTWRSRELRARGAFTGTFLIPIPSAGCGMGWAYFNPLVSPVLFECLTLKDFSLGAPVVKVTAELTRSLQNDTDN